MSGKDKLLYLIEHYKNGDYTINDFCNLYTRTFNLEVDDKEFTDDEWEHFEQFMRVASRYSPYDEDFVNCPNAFTDSSMVNEALVKLCNYLHVR